MPQEVKPIINSNYQIWNFIKNVTKIIKIPNIKVPLYCRYRKTRTNIYNFPTPQQELINNYKYRILENIMTESDGTKIWTYSDNFL